MSTRILIVGATGTVGADAARACVARGAEVTALCRSSKALLPQGVRRVAGDLEDARSLAAALDGIDAAFYISPHHEREEELGRAFADAMRAAGVKRLVLSTAFRFASDNPLVDSFSRWVMGLLGPHYRPKLRVERYMRRMGAVVLMPTNFYQNDDLHRDEILGGVYPLALGARPVSAVDTRDVADAAARGLFGELEPGGYAVVGPESLSGPARAAAWSSALGRPVLYAGDDLDAWERCVGDRMPPAKRADFKKTLRIIQKYGAQIGSRPLEETTALLGRPPRSFAEYARDRIAEWGVERAA